MARKREGARIQRGALTAEQAERLFATVDETGHTNEETAARQRRHRKEFGHGVDVDPLAGVDPSGSNVEKVITRTAVTFVLVFLAIVVALQVIAGLVRRASTANLAENVNITTVASALKGGVEWGNGFTQFPEKYSVQEADENTHRVEVTVTDTSSEDALEAFAGSQIQATAFSVNALLNPNIDTVIYRVNVHVDANGKFQTSSLFGFLQPTGEIKTLMTFIWTKSTTDTGVRFNCTITGVDKAMQEELRKNVTTSFTPSSILGVVLGDEVKSTTGETGEKDSAKSDASSGEKAATTTSSSSDAKAQDKSAA